MKPHAPYYTHRVYWQEQLLFKSLFEHNIYNFIGNCDVQESERHDILIYSAREGVYGDYRWLVPELKKPDVGAFIKSKAPKKSVLYMGLAWDDPQVYVASFLESILFCKDHRALWSHPLVNVDEKGLYETYFNGLAKRVGTFEAKIDRLKQLKDTLNCNQLIVPLFCLERHRDNGVKDEHGIVFVEHHHALDVDIVNRENLASNSRPFDCFFAGTVYAGIYPYRFAFNKILKDATDLKIKNNNTSYAKYKNTRDNVWLKTYEREVKEGIRPERSDFFLNRAFESLDQMQYEDYLQGLASSKIALCCASVFGYPVRKYWEAMAMGTVVVGQLPKDADKYGIVDGLHMVSCSIDDMEYTVRSLLNDPLRMEMIADNAKKLVQDRYSIPKLVEKWIPFFDN